MAEGLVPASVIVMVGLVVVTAIWQVLGIARDRVRSGDPHDPDVAALLGDLRTRIERLEQP